MGRGGGATPLAAHFPSILAFCGKSIYCFLCYFDVALPSHLIRDAKDSQRFLVSSAVIPGSCQGCWAKGGQAVWKKGCCLPHIQVTFPHHLIARKMQHYFFPPENYFECIYKFRMKEIAGRKGKLDRAASKDHLEIFSRN